MAQARLKPRLENQRTLQMIADAGGLKDVVILERVMKLGIFLPVFGDVDEVLGNPCSC